jgi:hypothetical protein
MSMKFFLRILACVVVVAGTSLSVQAGTINVQNGDFELPALGTTTSGWAYFANLSPEAVSSSKWTPSGQAGLASAGKPWPVPEGSSGQYAFLQSDYHSMAGGGTTTLTQTVSGFTVGNSYTVSFKDALLGSTDATDLSVYVDYGVVNTQTLLYSTSSASRTAWTDITTQAFTAAKDSYTLSLVSIDHEVLGGGQVLLVDNVSVSAVPEPGTLALAVAGVLGLLAYAWRKRK